VSRSVVAFLAMLLAAGSPAAAQTGRIEGSTETDGRYRISSVAAGTYALDVRRIGYRTRRVPGVAVTAGEAATADVRLFASPFQLDAVVVTGIVDPTQRKWGQVCAEQIRISREEFV
jgi:carboxypeptidase family protein